MAAQVFLEAGGGRAVGVDAGSGGGAQDAAGAVSMSLDACKQLPPAPEQMTSARAATWG